MKQRTGYLYKDGKRWVARVTFTDETGKRRNVKRYCETKTEARQKLDALKLQLGDRGQNSIEGDKLKFCEVARRYSETKLIEPLYVGERKVAGMRSLVAPRLYVKVLTEHFGNQRIRSITHASIEAFKLLRLKTPTRHGGERSIAAVNRELETLRTMLNFAKRQGWIAANPFEQGESLIERAAENSRDRILSFEEEERLLAACTGRLAHLRPIIILAADTGLRRGELFQLLWSDVDFETRTIRIRAKVAKSNKSREVAMTTRVEAELRPLWEASEEGLKGSVFGIKTDIKHGFDSARKAAGLEGVRFHDLRHTCVSRMIQAGVRSEEAMKVSGHSTLSMLNRYLNVNLDTSRRAADALDTLYQTVRTENQYLN